MLLTTRSSNNVLIVTQRRVQKTKNVSIAPKGYKRRREGPRAVCAEGIHVSLRRIANVSYAPKAPLFVLSGSAYKGQKEEPCMRISFPKRRREKRSAYKGQLAEKGNILRLGQKEEP